MGDAERGQGKKLILAARALLGLPEPAGARPRSGTVPRGDADSLAGRAPATPQPDGAPCRQSHDRQVHDRRSQGRRSQGRRIHVWRGHRPLIDLLLLAGACWRLPAMGGPPAGWDWPQLRAVADGLGVPWGRATLTALGGIEAEATRHWRAEWSRTHKEK